MSKLRIFHQGKLVQEYNLEGLDQCRIGRDANAEINLQDDVGVSRQHLELKKFGNSWVVECVARSKHLFKEGVQVAKLSLGHGEKFSIPGYEFEFVDQDAEANRLGGEAEDKTSVGMLPSVPTLVIYDSSGQAERTITLSGNSWIVGREPTSAVFIDHSKLSRRHFEIMRKEGAFWVRDLGSANGTFLNGRAIGQEQWVSLSSGDEIAIFDLKLRFILRDASFSERVEQAENYLAPYIHSSSGAQSEIGEGSLGDSPGLNKAKSFKEKLRQMPPVRIAIIVVLILGVLLYFAQEFSVKESNVTMSDGSPFEKLSPEQQENVKQLYQSAQMFLQQGKYELARQEVLKLHQIIPYYEDSRQIEETANQGIAMLQERERLEAEQKERERVEEQILAQVAECRKLLGPKVELYEIDLCLGPVLEFDPTHPEIMSLKADAQMIVDNRAIQDAARREFNKKAAQLKALYEKALGLDQKNDWLEAIPAYERVVRSKLPDPQGLKNLSKARSVELQEMILARQAEVEQKAEAAHKAGEIAKAIRILREAIAINPDNQIVVGRHAEWMSELRRAMMPIYQESVLEESVGEVESAKAKWKRIQAQSLPGEDYFERSKVKLKRYGVWK